MFVTEIAGNFQLNFQVCLSGVANFRKDLLNLQNFKYLSKVALIYFAIYLF